VGDNIGEVTALINRLLSLPVLCSPGLFGSYPWVDTHKKYAAFLMTFYLKNDGWQERYLELKKTVDKVF
jgi:hypothetical protein